MLEEALRNHNNSSSPETAATMMLSFIQSDLLPAGGAPSGAAVEQRFFRLYGPLMERIFGPMIEKSLLLSSSSKNDNIITIQSSKDGRNGGSNSITGSVSRVEDNNECRHMEGGWLAVESPWRGSTMSPNPSNMNHVNGMTKSHQPPSLDSDPVVKLLGGALTTTTSNTTTISTSSNNGRFNVNRTTGTLQQQQQQNQQPPTLIEAMSKESEARPNVVYSFPLTGLSNAIQESWVQLIRISITNASQQHQQRQQYQNQEKGNTMSTTTDNDLRLVTLLLRNPPMDQREIISHIQRTSVQVSMMEREYNLTSPRDPFQSISPSNSRPVLDTLQRNNSNEIGSEQQQHRPNILLDILEYYLFVFIRFPLAQPSITTSSSVSRNTSTGVNVHRIRSPVNLANRQETYGESLYYHLFRRYLRLFLPFESSSSISTSSAIAEGSVRTISFGAKENGSNMPKRIESVDNIARPTGLLRESELFLRVIIALWLESPTRLLSTPFVIDSIQQRRMRASGLNGMRSNSNNNNNNTNFDLDSSFDLVQTHNIFKYDPPPMQVKRCLRTLIVHALLDPVVKSLLLLTNEKQQLAPSPMNSPTRSRTQADWCMTSCMTALQLPLYNFIRVTFRHASIHAPESPFYVALNMWLIWLEPWNAIQCMYYFLLQSWPSFLLVLSF
jgi:hypothetical protein